MKNFTFADRLMSRCAVLVLGACLALPGAAQDAGDAIEIVRQGIPHDALFALEMSGEWGLAVGAFGLMLETNDGGNSWNLIAPKTPAALLGVDKAGDRQIIVGQGGLVMTRDGDADWTVVDTPFEQRLLNVALAESGRAVAIGEFGFIALSDDAGATWRTVTPNWEDYNEDGYEPHLYDAEIQADGTMLIAGEFGLVLRSTDNGETWPAVASGDQSVFDMHFARDGSNTAYAVGQEGLVLRSNDSGGSWARIDVGTSANLLGVWSGNGEVVISGIREMLRSSDDGASFTKTEDIKIIRHWFQGIAAGVAETKSGDEGFLRAQNVYVVGHKATIGRVTQ
ncbi:MAG: WD40/YVTN/BNR-like repeat-containing protein [Gammaproteobacteria bacterium]